MTTWTIDRHAITELTARDRDTVEQHFLALDGNDRRLRFGTSTSDATLRRYVARIDHGRDSLFGVFDAGPRLIAAVHVARVDGGAELGLSVLRAYRNRGYGRALLARARLRARRWGARALILNCLAENAGMIHLARKLGMNIVIRAGEADACLDLSARREIGLGTPRLVAEPVC